MTSCSIFSAASYIEAVCKEIDHLADQTKGILAELGWDPSYDDDFTVDESHSALRYARRYLLSRAYRNQRKAAELVLHFDLFRSPCEGGWEGAKQALLIVGYSPLNGDGGWDSETLAPQDNGQMTDANVREWLSPALEDRLMVWDRPGGASDYAKAEWLFAVRLSEITDIDALNRMVILPIRSLLDPVGAPEKGLETANAIHWPAQLT
ncbi:MAG: hypothetical protein EON59_07160 [Alphaproteobacteria bacterium]|nr:MAG: hypothetical protein EON59_07160 [Alphaproteobacteria bacterium]